MTPKLSGATQVVADYVADLLMPCPACHAPLITRWPLGIPVCTNPRCGCYTPPPKER